MSIKVYDKVTGQWITQASNQAGEITLIDVADNFQSEHVEGALREIATTLTEQQVDTDILKDRVDNISNEVEGVITDIVDNQLTTINRRLDDIDDEIDYLKANGGGGGGGSAIVPTITSTFEAEVIEQDEALTINIFFTSPALGEGTAYVIINGIETSVQAVKQGSNNINVGVLPKLENTVSIYVKDRSGMMSNQLTWKIIAGGINVSLDFDDTTDYPFGEDIRMPFTIETASTEPIIMNLTVGSNITQVSCEKGYNEYLFKNLGVGIHKVSFYFTTGKYRTKTFNFNLVVVNSKNLYVSSTFEGGEFTFGTPLSVNYRVSKLSTELFTVNLMIDNEIVKTLEVTAGSYYWTINTLALGPHKLKIEAHSISGEYSFVEMDIVIVEGAYTPVEPVQSGLIAWFDASERTNQDSNKTIWTDKTGNGNLAKLHNFNYYSNGWIDNELVCDGDAYVEIDMKPYADNVRLGSTIDIQFTSYNIGLEEARVLDYTGIDAPNKGIYINTLETKLTSLTSNGKVALDEDTETRLTYIIDRDNKFAKIYVDGVLCRAFYLSDSGSGVNKLYEDFTHDQKIYLNSEKGIKNFGKCKIKSLRIYNRALSHDEVLQNHIADIKDLKEQQKIYDFNYNNFTTPTIHMYTTENGNFDNMTNLVSQEIRVKYTSPNEDLYGQSFDLPYCQVQWQGTSSVAYVLKNYQIWLKDEDKADYYYTPFKKGKPEKVLTAKADYMESTHAHNTGLAKFVNECLYDTKNPAQLLDEDYLNSVTGFPCLLYIDDELIGVYNFNLDRYSIKSLGYEKFPKCLSYEISANSDTTAGAFFKWKPESGKTEIEYLQSDFECRYPEDRVQGNDTFDELKRLVDWVSDATDEQFKEQISQYFNLEYLIRYYLFTLFVGAVDNLGKNMMITTFDGLVWYPQFYDLDTTLGIDNTGFLKFDCDK